MFSNRLNNTSDYESFINSLSTHINKILGLDREENIEILELNGRVVQVVLTQIDLKFHIMIDNNPICYQTWTSFRSRCYCFWHSFELSNFLLKASFVDNP